MRIILLLLALCLHAQHHHPMHGMYGPYPMNRDATGTSWMPSSTHMPDIHILSDEWFVMIHGFLMAIYDDQGGPYGDDKFFSENMFMATAQKDYGMGTLGLRSMISLEPATVGCNGYPLLLQSGETCNGKKPLINRQHPHDFLMELAGVYTLRFSRESSFFAYFGYPGEPALGPPAYIHRFSAFYNPEAPITHHWLDSTHIVFGVGTLGFVYNWFKIDASIFTGREPNQHRWGFDKPRFDSYSARISINPTPNIAAQISYGYLKSPEQLEPNVNIGRATASISYNKAWACNNWQVTAAWGQNRNHPGHNLNGALLESAIEISKKHVFFGRGEYVEKDDLSPLKVAKVGKIDLGYIYEFNPIGCTLWGLGAVGSASFFKGTDLSYMVFFRIDLASN
ncbi:MAG: hypothetical protein K1X28_05055 [Parachlamydiales bacterium]|nr:hypothetical protein [Parachlamydiales bacterium]